VIRMAPIQSTRLSSSVEGSSPSMTKYPKTRNAKVKPDHKYNGPLHVALQPGQTQPGCTCIHSSSPGQLHENTAKNVAEGCPNRSAGGKGCKGNGT